MTKQIRHLVEKGEGGKGEEIYDFGIEMDWSFYFDQMSITKDVAIQRSPPDTPR